MIKAIRHLGGEVSSVQWLIPCAEDKGEAWIASGVNVSPLNPG